MAHDRFRVDELTIGDVTLLVSGSVIVVERDDDTTEWELIVATVVAEPLEPGVYEVAFGARNEEVETRWTGRALHVRSVENSHVFRSAGPLTRTDT